MLDFVTIKDVKSNVGAWCRSMRKAERLTKQELAEEIGLSRFTIAKLENGENPTLETLLKVLQYFDKLKSFNQFVLEENEGLTNSQSMY
ncbi:helix-turn-helix transcriptional regulator [Soonwooa sp.]|uniref:helix-turn-helix transcriptional regulator n=1 Tax=Soonwooa sp. TaxID=1938592 RepID=UPI0026341F9F|nr:helix-turn-helix transcriptional regulator [Soonwooa sp.]